MRNLTDLDRRPLVGDNPAGFRTWDNNPKGVKVFILAGQSNMVGRGSVETGHGGVPGAIGSLRYQAVNDPANYARLLEDPSSPAKSPWRVRDDVKVWRNSSGQRGGDVGHYYLLMIDNIRQVLNQLGTEFPEWNGLGYQIAGFGWHQGWSDASPIPAAEYEANMIDLINDLRAELGQPRLPVAIAATGHGGANQGASFAAVLAAQLALADPARHPALAGTVFTADTRPFWREPAVSPNNDGSHWHGNGESFFLIGKSMGQGMIDLLSPPK